MVYAEILELLYIILILPESCPEYLKKGFFLYFFPFRLDEIKVGGKSCLLQHFANTKRKIQTNIQTVGSATVSQNWRLCWGINKWGIP